MFPADMHIADHYNWQFCKVAEVKFLRQFVNLVREEHEDLMRILPILDHDKVQDMITGMWL